MDISPEVVGTIAAGPLGVFIVGYWINKSMKRIDNIPEIVTELKNIREALIKVDGRLDILSARKETDREEIIKLRENAKAVWRNIDEIKVVIKAQTQ